MPGRWLKIKKEGSMTNLALFLLTTVYYSCLYILWCTVCKKPIGGLKKCAKKLALVALLCAPFNIGGNVFTVIGNAEGKSVYSVFSLYQKAEVTAFAVVGWYQESKLNAFAVTGITFQKAGGDAITGIGLALYQKTGYDAVTFVGISVYQKADGDYSIAMTGAGLVLYQKPSYNAITGLGLVLYQKPGHNAITGIGLVLYQKPGHNAVTGIGLSVCQKAGNFAKTGLGIAGYQRAGTQAGGPIGIAFYQRVGGVAPTADRAFGVASTLYAPQPSAPH